MIYCQIDLSVAENHIHDHDEVFADIAENILQHVDDKFATGPYLKGKFSIEDFDSAYDEKVKDFLETCISSFTLFIGIQHELDGRSKIILS